MAGTNVAVLQSNYLPWKGYFDIIHDVDLFIFYDDVQFTKNDWRNRNRIKTPAGTAWLTVPVGQDIDRRICDVRITDPRWQRTHYRTLAQNYARAPYFPRYKAWLESVYLERTWTDLSSLNRHLIEGVCRELGIAARFADSRDWALEGRAGDRLLQLLRKAGAARYVSGPSASAYLDADLYAREGITVTYKSYEGYPEYAQPHPPFDPRVSIVDLLFCTGPEAPRHIWGWRGER